MQNITKISMEISLFVYTTDGASIVNLLLVLNAPWISLSRPDQLSYISSGSKGEPRFSHKTAEDPHLYPELPSKVLAYNRHIDDKNVRLIPDFEFIVHQFSQFMQHTLRYDIAYEEKISKIFWRGTEHSMLTEYVYSYDGTTGSTNSPNSTRIDQRNLLTVLSNQVIFDLDIRPILNASFERTPMSEFFLYKYLLDVDGYVSAWSGGFWKLYSNSVVMKAPSLWEQWYYEDLKPYIHYLPLKTLHPKDIRDLFLWCEANRQRCKKIAQDSAKFVRTLSYEYSIKDYSIH